MSTTSIELWRRGCQRLAAELPEHQFNTWIRPLVAEATAPGAGRPGRSAAFAGAEEPEAGAPEPGNGADAPAEAATAFAVRVPNRFKLDWIRSQYAGRIEAVLSELAGHPVRVDLILAPRPEAGARGAGPPPTDDEAPAPGAAGAAALPPAAAAPARSLPPAATSHRLNTALTFDTLVPGRANSMARTAALHVAGAPGGNYNPLFIYGGVGLGKTHLVHAVGNALLKDRPDARVLYLHAEQFISDVVKNYQRKTFDELKAKYHQLDLLLIDDVQFFAGKERTQEEFFHTFNALLEGQQQVILTCDRYPKEVAGLEERLKSRFGWGLTVAIEPPELETCAAILKTKAEATGVTLSDEVALFIAKRIRSNVRELEGALRRVIANSRFTGEPITLEFTKEALKDLLSLQARLITIENIQKTVADYYKLRVSELLSERRSRSVARPRQVAMALAKELTSHSLPEIGEAFGGRDHTTVLHACRRIKELRGAEQRVGEDYSNLLRTLTA